MAGSDAPSLSGFRDGRALKVLLLARDLPRGTPRELEVSFLKGVLDRPTACFWLLVPPCRPATAIFSQLQQQLRAGGGQQASASLRRPQQACIAPAAPHARGRGGMEGGPESYTLQEKLGEGSFGKVYKALEIPTGRTVAVKIVPIEQDTGEVAREIEMLKTCNSANIVRYYNSFTRGSELWIVMEFCAGSSLGDIMEARSRCLTEVQIAAVLAGTLAGLAYLHDLNKIHRDIKAGNLLLTDKGQVKLADFGVSAQARGTPSFLPLLFPSEVRLSPRWPACQGLSRG
eukprot:scaffold15414_cov114-Isochrysis_galbana.AAC.9